MNNEIMIKNELNDIDELDNMEETRLNICKQCGLYLDTPMGAICNNNLYMNVDDKTAISEYQKNNFKRGCGCKLSHITKVPFRHCSFNKW